MPRGLLLVLCQAMHQLNVKLLPNWVELERFTLNYRIALICDPSGNRPLKQASGCLLERIWRSGQLGGNSQIWVSGEFHFLKVLSCLKNKFLGPFSKI